MDTTITEGPRSPLGVLDGVRSPRLELAARRRHVRMLLIEGLAGGSTSLQVALSQLSDQELAMRVRDVLAPPAMFQNSRHHETRALLRGLLPTARLNKLDAACKPQPTSIVDLARATQEYVRELEHR